MIHQVIFWLHMMVIPIAIFIGFALPLGLVILAVVLHRIHVIIFGECIISLFQKRIGSFKKDVDFTQVCVKRFIKKSITSHQSKLIDYTISISPIVIALIKLVKV